MVFYNAFLIFMLLFVLGLLFVITSAFIGFVVTRVPFVPTYAYDIKYFVKKLGISSKDMFFDLGSGDGKVALLVEELSGAKVRGYELTWWTHLLAKAKAKLRGSKAEFKNQNFFKTNWSEANIIYCYLYPPLMGRVEEKFKTEMAPGSLAVVRDFPFPNMPYAEKFLMPKKHDIYVYKI